MTTRGDPRKAFLGLGAIAGRAYVTNQRAGTVTILDTAINKPIGTIKVGAGPRGIAIGPDGRIDVAVSDTARTAKSAADAILAIDPKTRKVVARYDAGTTSVTDLNRHLALASGSTPPTASAATSR